MKALPFVLLPLLIAAPFFISSNYLIEFGILVFIGGYVGQAWNIPGGFGGQISFGHTIFFGIGAYCSAILTTRYNVNPWAAAAIAPILGGVVGAGIGLLSFRFGLKGSYFALVTLAFAEVFRILADVIPIGGKGLGTLIPVQQEFSMLQFQDPRAFYFLALAMVCFSTAMSMLLMRSRWGSFLVAVRENESAAQALGINALAIKTASLAVSGALTAVAGTFYVQKYLYIDPHLAFGVGRSVEMLLVCMIGGAGTIIGPLVGSLGIGLLGEVTRAVSSAPGLSLMIYGVILVLVVAYLPKGLVGLAELLPRRRS